MSVANNTHWIMVSLLTMILTLRPPRDVKALRIVSGTSCFGGRRVLAGVRVYFDIEKNLRVFLPPRSNPRSSLIGGLRLHGGALFLEGQGCAANQVSHALHGFSSAQ